MRGVLSTYAKMSRGCFVRGCFVLHSSSCESLSRLNLGQLYWLIGSHDTIHLKMALKTILIFRGKSSHSDKGYCSVEVDTTTSEPSSNPSKMKFPHVYQDEKCNEKWLFLKNRTMASLAIKHKTNAMRDEL